MFKYIKTNTHLQNLHDVLYTSYVLPSKYVHKVQRQSSFSIWQVLCTVKQTCTLHKLYIRVDLHKVELLYYLESSMYCLAKHKSIFAQGRASLLFSKFYVLSSKHVKKSLSVQKNRCLIVSGKVYMYYQANMYIRVDLYKCVAPIVSGKCVYSKGQVVPWHVSGMYCQADMYI